LLGGEVDVRDDALEQIFTIGVDPDVDSLADFDFGDIGLLDIDSDIGVVGVSDHCQLGGRRDDLAGRAIVLDDRAVDRRNKIGQDLLAAEVLVLGNRRPVGDRPFEQLTCGDRSDGVHFGRHLGIIGLEIAAGCVEQVEAVGATGQDKSSQDDEQDGPFLPGFSA